MLKYIRLLRPNSYVSFIDFLAGFFIVLPAGAYRESLLLLFLVFVSFTVLVYPGMYIINDLIDLPKDRLHPDKKHRPIAAGEIRPCGALSWGLFLITSGLALGFITGPTVFYFEISFLVINLLYSSLLKNIPYIELLVGTSTHPLRTVFAICVFGHLEPRHGPLILGIASLWFIGLALRRHKELVELGNRCRPSLCGYSPKGLLNLIIICFILLFMLFFWCDSLSSYLILGVIIIFALALFLGYIRGSGYIEKVVHYILTC